MAGSDGMPVACFTPEVAMRRLLCALIVVHAIALADTAADPFSFFLPCAELSPGDRQALDRGEPVISVIDAKGHELAVFSAIQVGAAVTRERATAWMRHIEELRRGSYLLATGRFSPEPRLEDLEALTLDDSDLRDIRACRPGNCDIKLSASEIARLHGVIASSGGRWKENVQRAFREIVLARVRAFGEGGLGRLEDYNDRKHPRSPVQAFSRLLDRSVFLDRHVPHLTRHLALCASHPVAGGESFTYWSQERLGKKAVVSATRVTLVHGDGRRGPELLMVGVQIFATHYLDAALGVTALVRDERAARSYFVHVNRSDVDVLGGFWGPFVRPMIESRIRRDAPGVLRQVSARLSNGDPRPVPGQSGSPPARR